MKKMVLASAALMSAAATQAQQAAGPVDTLTAQAMQEVVVQGVRAPKNAPFAVSNIKKQDLETFSKTGQELPFLFANTPGVLAWSENGTGMGTSYMRIRGAAGSRINVTLDGVSLNSPEDQTVCWANMNSYAALMGSVQIQRGIGTSTHGDGAFGGSVALATATPSLKPSLELTGSYGSFNTYHAGAKFSTGLLFNHLIFDGAYNETATDGFVHGTASRAGSYYGGLTWLDEKFKVSYKNIGNFEKTGQAWSGVTAGNNDLSLMDGTWGASTGIRTYKDMYEHGLGKYNTLYENLVTDENGQFVKDANGNYQTYRYKMADGSYWEKTTDNFYQNHNILSAVFTPSDHWSHNVAIHYTYGYGYYSELRPDNKLSKFGLTYKDANGNKIKRDDMVRRKGLTQHNYGVLYNINYKDETWNVTGGLYLQQFRGNHFGYLTYFKNQELNNHFRPNNSNYQYYDSDARKFDYSAFFKANYHFNDYWNLFADVQYRYVQYNTSGRNDKFYEETSGYFNQPLNVSERYNFVNPKTGISFAKDGHHAYASIAYANREPERNNFTDNGAYPAPTPERLMDIELGYNYHANNWYAGVNLYYMDYTNQFVQTGAQSDIGENLTTNIKDSYRMGAEIEAGWSPLSFLTLEGNAALSRNRIKDFDEMASVDWESSFRKIHYSSSTLAFSPSAILNGFATFHYQGAQLIWHTNFVSRQYLDNTENNVRSLPCYSQTNIHANYTFRPGKRFAGLREVVVGCDFNNIFNRHYAASGWVYSTILDNDGHPNDNRYTQIGWIPMAGFNVMGNITLKF